MSDRKLNQFRAVDLSMWQSSLDEIFSSAGGDSPAASFMDLDAAQPAIRAVDEVDAGTLDFAEELAAMHEATGALPHTDEAGAAAGLVDTTKFCASTAFKAIFSRDPAERERLRQQLKAEFGGCDPKWAQVVEIYLAHRAAGDNALNQYRRYTDIGDFVLNDRLPDNGLVGLLADWGTGQKGAQGILAKIQEKQPHVVMHLGDVYYSGTDKEFQKYFYSIWQKTLGLPQVAWGEKLTDLATGLATFTLAGNHDMYAGGGPYYTAIDMIGQPASYFCLRNRDWQLIALDTGLHDANPVGGSTTRLEDQEVVWLKDKIATAGGRKTLLFSHHQLFSAYEKIGDSFVNQTLLAQVQDILPQVTAWFWGHEHNFIAYGRHLNVLARCIGHASFPVGRDEQGPVKASDIALADIRLGLDGGLFQHGYAMLQLNGGSAEVTYYQYNATTDTETEFDFKDRL